jgi:coenzyme F420-reducing hydrogenase alpha subunit
VVYAFEEALKIMKRRAWPSEARKALQNVVAGEGISATEAPRGLIFHRYRVDEAGKIEFAKIVPPTSQNQSQIESDLRQLLPTIADKQDQQIAIDCERLIRSYDPCISCSTHFLKVNIARDGLRPE